MSHFTCTSHCLYVWNDTVTTNNSTNEQLSNHWGKNNKNTNCFHHEYTVFLKISSHIDRWAVSQMCLVVTCIKLYPINNGQWNIMSQSWRIALVTYATRYIIVIIWTKYTMLKSQWSICSRNNSWCGWFLRVNNSINLLPLWFLTVSCVALWLFLEFCYLSKSLIFCNCFSTSDFR